MKKRLPSFQKEAAKLTKMMSFTRLCVVLVASFFQVGKIKAKVKKAVRKKAHCMRKGLALARGQNTGMVAGHRNVCVHGNSPLAF
jgi:hypothetical protein